ncbi:fimbrial protein [Klebsiella oxytoca]|uniref:fimbrial protein n=1 Tax=Klebsiella oxytoca TaxID=571 RepID=UPI0034D1C406
MTMKVNKRMAARLTAAALALASYGTLAASASVEMTGEVVDSTCALAPSSQSVSVDLGRPSVGDFTGQPAGYAATSSSFNLQLEGCSGITGLQVWASGAQTEPGLTNAIKNTATSGATGVAMQIFHNSNTSVALNPNADATSALSLTVPDTATHQLDFTAKMVKIAAAQTPTAGPVEGHVTLNVGYQ